MLTQITGVYMSHPASILWYHGDIKFVDLYEVFLYLPFYLKCMASILTTILHRRIASYDWYLTCAGFSVMTYVLGYIITKNDKQ